MAVTTTNLIQGAATLYVANFGATEPATLATAPGAGWTDVGATTGGLKLSINQSYAALEADQIVDRAASAMTGREVTVETNFAEATLQNLLVALNNYGTVSSAAGTSTFAPNGGLLPGAPTYSALLLDGLAPGGLRRRVIVRKVLSTDAVEATYNQDTQTVWSASFTAHYVSSTVGILSIVDATA